MIFFKRKVLVWVIEQVFNDGVTLTFEFSWVTRSFYNSGKGIPRFASMCGPFELVDVIL